MGWKDLGDALLILVAWAALLAPLVPWIRDTRADRLRTTKCLAHPTGTPLVPGERGDPGRAEAPELTAARAELESYVRLPMPESRLRDPASSVSAPEV